MPKEAQGKKNSKQAATAAPKKPAKPRAKPKAISPQDKDQDLEDEIERLKGVVKRHSRLFNIETNHNVQHNSHRKLTLEKTPRTQQKWQEKKLMLLRKKLMLLRKKLRRRLEQPERSHP
jgi:hypothetical protein